VLPPCVTATPSVGKEDNAVAERYQEGKGLRWGEEGWVMLR
jgi:hypothetical protein